MWATIPVPVLVVIVYVLFRTIHHWEDLRRARLTSAACPPEQRAAAVMPYIYAGVPVGSPASSMAQPPRELMEIMRAHVLSQPHFAYWGPAARWRQVATRRAKSPWAIMNALPNKPFAGSLKLIENMADSGVVAYMHGVNVLKSDVTVLRRGKAGDTDAWLADMVCLFSRHMRHACSRVNILMTCSVGAQVIDAWVRLWCDHNGVYSMAMSNKTIITKPLEHIVTSSFLAKQLRQDFEETAEEHSDLQENHFLQSTIKRAKQFKYVNIFQCKTICARPAAPLHVRALAAHDCTTESLRLVPARQPLPCTQTNT